MVIFSEIETSLNKIVVRSKLDPNSVYTNGIDKSSYM